GQRTGSAAQDQRHAHRWSKAASDRATPERNGNRSETRWNLESTATEHHSATTWHRTGTRYPAQWPAHPAAPRSQYRDSASDGTTWARAEFEPDRPAAAQREADSAARGHLAPGAGRQVVAGGNAG